MMKAAVGGRPSPPALPKRSKTSTTLIGPSVRSCLRLLLPASSVVSSSSSLPSPTDRTATSRESTSLGPPVIVTARIRSAIMDDDSHPHLTWMSQRLATRRSQSASCETAATTHNRLAGIDDTTSNQACTLWTMSD